LYVGGWSASPSLFLWWHPGLNLGLGSCVRHVRILGSTGVDCVFLHPVIFYWGMINWVLVSFVVEPAEPLRWHHGPVIVNIVLGVVDDPPVSSVEVFIVFKILVSKIIFSNQLSCLQVISKIVMIKSSFHTTMVLNHPSKLCKLVEPNETSKRHFDLL